MKKYLLLGIVVVLVIFTSGFSQEAVAADFLGLTSVFNKKRSTSEDTIYLKNNDVLIGRVLNKTIQITTPYDHLTVPLRKCAGLSFEGSTGDKETLVTINFNRISGIITDRTIRFTVRASGRNIKIRKEKIRLITLKRSQSESAFNNPKIRNNLFVMANHDLLTGLPAAPQIRIETDHIKMPVPFADIDRITLKGGHKASVELVLKNNKTMQASLRTEEISLNLDIGVLADAIYQNQFSKMFIGDGNQQIAAYYGGKQPREKKPDPARSLPLGGDTIINSIGMKFVRIKPGSFMMGSVQGDAEEMPAHKVTITKPFYMGVHEVTQKQWQDIMGDNPSEFKNPDKPVENVSWNDVQIFIKKLSKKEKIHYRLPTEAEWEYACRAGTDTDYYWGDDFSGDHAWDDSNTSGETQATGQKKPNAWGLYDMSGNVWEWCEDFYGQYSPRPATDPLRLSGSGRVIRGGGWSHSANSCRSRSRFHFSSGVSFYSLGFRLVRLK